MTAQGDSVRNPHPGAPVCPSCRAHSHQPSNELLILDSEATRDDERIRRAEDWTATRCVSCREFAMFRFGHRVWPVRTKSGPDPDPDMPTSVREPFEEARTVAPLSRKSAAALLRLALQTLDDLATGAGSINEQIGRLVQRGLDPKFSKLWMLCVLLATAPCIPGRST